MKSSLSASDSKQIAEIQELSVTAARWNFFWESLPRRRSVELLAINWTVGMADFLFISVALLG